MFEVDLHSCFAFFFRQEKFGHEGHEGKERAKDFSHFALRTPHYFFLQEKFDHKGAMTSCGRPSSVVRRLYSTT